MSVEPMASKLDRVLASTMKRTAIERAAALASAGLIKSSEVSRIAAKLGKKRRLSTR